MTRDDRVRNIPFEAVADLDAHLALALDDQQQEPVVDLLLPELPLLDRANRKVLERITFDDLIVRTTN